MGTNRLEAFSDGVLAIIITIMVLELKVPHCSTLDALGSHLLSVLSYILSFVYLGIYWNNHHHLLKASRTRQPAPPVEPAPPVLALAHPVHHGLDGRE